MEYDIWGKPIATPTPYVSPQKGGNAYIVPGSQTQPVAQNAYPIQSLSSGGVKFSTGTTVPSANVWGSGNQTVARTTQNANLGANNTKLITDTTNTGGNGGGGGDTGPMAGFNMSYYPGWGEAEAKADWLATGGSKAKSGGGGGQKANSLDESGNEIYDASLPSLDEQANWIFQDLDKQVAGYDDYKAGMKSELDANAVDQKLAAGEAKDTNVGALTDSANKEIDRSSGTLRDLTTNANDLLQRLVQMYGGGSSAEAAMTGMGRTINQQRGGVLNARDTALRDIESKKVAVNSTYVKQSQAIDKWVDDNMIKIGNQIQGWIGDIANAKASVRAQLSAKAVDSARNYLTQLALSKENYKQQLDFWKQSRDGELSDYKAKLQLTAQYNPTQYQYDLNPNKTSSNGNGASNNWMTTNNNSNSGKTLAENYGGSSDLLASLKTSPLDDPDKEK